MIRRFAALFAGWLVGGCDAGSHSTPTRTSVVAESAGVTIVSNSAPRDSTVIEILDSVPYFDFGADTADYIRVPSPRQLWFPLPVKALALAGERVVVADPASCRLEIYDSLGHRLSSIGQCGYGPLEFKGLDFWNVLDGDSLVVYDAALRRFTWVATSGLSPAIKEWRNPAGEHFWAPIAMVGTNVFVRNYDTKGIGGPLHRDTVLFGVAINLTDNFRMIGQYSGMTVGVVENAIYTDLPFDRFLQIAAGDSFVAIGDNEDFTFSIYDAKGTLDRVVRRAHVKRAITDQVMEDLAAAQVGRSSADFARFRDALKRWPRLPSIPAYDHLIVSRQGEIWLREDDQPNERAKPGRFSVFDRQGIWDRTVLLPPGFVPTWIDKERIIGYWQDDEDLVHIRGYRYRYRGQSAK